MNFDLLAIIEHSRYPALMRALQARQLPQALALIDGHLHPANVFGRLKRLWQPLPGTLMLRVVRAVLQGQEPGNLPLSFRRDYSLEVAELGRALLLLEPSQPAQADALASVLLDWLTAAGKHVQANSNDYPRRAMNAQIWMDGAVLQSWGRMLAEYYRRRENAAQEYEAWYACGRVTMAVMSHYKHFVGPVMIGTGNALEKLGRPAEAAQYYRAVVADFADLLAETEELIQAEDADEPMEFEQEAVALQCLRTACVGLLRLEPGAPDISLQKQIAAIDGVLARWPLLSDETP